MATAANLNAGKGSAGSAGVLSSILSSPRNRVIAVLVAAALALGIGYSVSKRSEIADFFGRASGELTKAAKAAGSVPLAERFAALINQRSPGERTAGELSSTKRRYAQVATRTRPQQRALGKTRPGLPAPFVEALTAPPVVEVPVPVPAESIFSPLAESPPVPVPGSTAPFIGGGCCTGGGGTPPSTTPASTPTPPTEVPAVPEPSTWLMMILGFYLCGQALKKQRVAGSRAQPLTA